MRAFLTVLIVLGAIPAYAQPAPSGESTPRVLRIGLDDQAITPATARFVIRALRQAEQQRCECLVIELNTPGGLLDSTRQVVSAVLTSRVPVVVYVSPHGARAASAGLFITLSSHVAAMAPGTRIGAAHPVQLGGLPIMPQPPAEEPQKEQPAEQTSAMTEKLVNDTVAWARGLAVVRGRNAEWAALAVSESRVMLASEAVAENVVDLQAVDLNDLLRLLDGREVTTGKTTVRLNTANAQVTTLSMWWGEHFLSVISNPNVVMILLMLGVYGILFELYSPGWGVAGTLGAVCLVLSFFGLAVLPVNYAGLALIILALGMFVAEVNVTSFGTLTIGGIICLILGGTMLVDSPTGFAQVSLAVLIPIAVATGVISVFLLGQIFRAHRRRVQTGMEAMMRQCAVAQEKFVPDQSGFHGQVFVRGELWNAHCADPVGDGQDLVVTGRDGLVLTVIPRNALVED